MQKKIIALAIAAAFAAPAVALADTANVEVYGRADVSYDMTKNGQVSANKVSSNVSRIGLKGTEDLGGGLNAIWQIETTVNMDGTAGPTTLGNRNTFAGVASESMGKVILGRHDTPYKIATRGMDQFADSIADNRSIMGTALGSVAGGGVGVAAHEARATDVVAYISPAMSGMTVAAAYVANAEGVTTAAANNKGSAYSLAAMYDNAGINGAFAYQAIKGGNGSNASLVGGVMANNDKTTAWKLAGGYTMDAINVNAIYEKTDYVVAAGTSTKQTNIYLSGKYSMGNDAVKLAYTRAGKAGGVAGTDASQFSVGYDHSMSKRTTVYALYTQVSNKSSGATTAAYGLGNQTTGAVAAAAGFVGQKPTAFSFGMKHTF